MAKKSIKSINETLETPASLSPNFPPPSTILTPDERMRLAQEEIQAITDKYNVIIEAKLTICQIPGAVLPVINLRVKS